MKLDSGQIHLMRLAAKEADAEGWAKVSKIVWQIIDVLPDDLVEKRESDDGGHIRLTDHGMVALKYAI